MGDEPRKVTEEYRGPYLGYGRGWEIPGRPGRTMEDSCEGGRDRGSQTGGTEENRGSRTSEREGRTSLTG